MSLQEKRERQGNRIKITFNISSSSPNSEILLWILDNLEGSKVAKEKAIDAIRAFWLPDCRQEAGHSTAQLQRTARIAIWRLQEQIYYLQSLFNIEPTLIGLSTSSGMESTNGDDRRQMSLVPKDENLESKNQQIDSFNLQDYDWSIEEVELGKSS